MKEQRRERLQHTNAHTKPKYHLQKKSTITTAAGDVAKLSHHACLPPTQPSICCFRFLFFRTLSQHKTTESVVLRHLPSTWAAKVQRPPPSASPSLVVQTLRTSIHHAYLRRLHHLRQRAAALREEVQTKTKDLRRVQLTHALHMKDDVCLVLLH
jgi:predicted nucleic acid-binding Zn ribbon protein